MMITARWRNKIYIMTTENRGLLRPDQDDYPEALGIITMVIMEEGGGGWYAFE